MYKLLFSDKSFIEVPDVRSMHTGLAQWNGKDYPKYLYLWFKSRYFDHSQLKTWQDDFSYKELIKVVTYNDEGKITSVIPVPKNFIQAYFEEGDLLVTYGDPVWADEAY